MHAVLERWHTHAEAPDPRTLEGQCALPALPHVPPPRSPGTVVEHAFAFVFDGTDDGLVIVDVTGTEPGPFTASFEGRTHVASTWSDAVFGVVGELEPGRVLYTGRIDLIDDYRPRLSVRVTDYKSCGDLPARVEEMRARIEDDAQFVIYTALAKKLFDVPIVHGRWLYLQRPHGKTRPRCEAVDLSTGPGIFDRLRALHRTDGLAIVRAHGAPPDSLPRTLSHCSAYGGCPYRGECWGTMSLLERTHALLAAKEHTTMTAAPDFLSSLAASIGQAPAVDPRASWTKDDHDAFATLTASAAGQTPYPVEQILAFLDQNGRPHVSGYWRSQQQAAAASAPVVHATPTAPAPTLEGAAPRKRGRKAAPVPVVEAPTIASVPLTERLVCALERIADALDDSVE